MSISLDYIQTSTNSICSLLVMLDISFSYALFWEHEFYVTFFFFFRLFKQTVSVFSVEVSGKEIVDSYAYLVIFIECNMILFWVHCW